MQCASMAVVAYLYNHNERFFVGWNLGPSWAMATASWAVQTVIAGVVVVTALLMAPEGDYELI